MMRGGSDCSRASASGRSVRSSACIADNRDLSASCDISSRCSARNSGSTTETCDGIGMNPSRKAIVVSVLAGLLVSGTGLTQRFFAHESQTVTSAPWVEPDFPFFSSIVDARKAGTGFPPDNLTPRGIVVRVGPETWAAFDVDLLRISAIWRGKGVTAVALAPGSYHHPDRKTPAGQSALPEPDGSVWLANGIYPGW